MQPIISPAGIVPHILFLDPFFLHDDTGVGSNTLILLVYFPGLKGKRSYRPELRSLLSDRASDGGSLHFTLGVDDLSYISSSSVVV